MSYSADVLALSPIWYARLGEASGTNAVDASGNGHDGTYNNTPTLGVAGPLVGDSDTAVTFASASSEDVRAGFFSALNTTTFTLVAWVNGTGNNQAILGRQGTSTAPYCMLVDTNGKLRCDIKSTSGANPTGNYIDSSATTINGGTWHMVAVSRDGSGTVAFYVDGVQTSTVGSTLTPYTGGSLGLAVASRGGTPFYNGSIDEPAIFNTVLTPTQIAALYTSGSSYNGPFASTLADATMAASGAETFTGTLAATLDDATLAGTAVETFTGTLAATLDDTTLAAAGDVTGGSNDVTGDLAATLDDVALDATGAESIEGAAEATLDDATLTASGAETIAGSLSTPLDDATLAAFSDETVVGTMVVTLDDAGMAATGAEAINGTVSITLTGATVAASGVETIAGTAAVTLDDATLDALAEEAATGILAAVLDDVQLDALGDVNAEGARNITVTATLDAARWTAGVDVERAATLDPRWTTTLEAT